MEELFSSELCTVNVFVTFPSDPGQQSIIIWFLLMCTNSFHMLVESARFWRAV